MTRRRRTATITIGAALLAMAGCANSRSQNNQVDASTPTADAPDIPIVEVAPADGLVYLNRAWHRLDDASRIEDPAI